MYALLISLQLSFGLLNDSTIDPFPFAIRDPLKGFNWKKIELPVSKKYKDSVVKMLKPAFKNMFDATYAGSENFSHAFHFVELNGDQLVDVIYEGWSGSEGNDVIFYINTGTEFKEFFRNQHYFNHQHLAEICFQEKHLSSFTLYDEGCCNPDVEIEKHYAAGSNLQTRLSLQRAIIVGMRENNLTYRNAIVEFENPVHFKVLSEGYSMRLTPEIIDSIPIWSNLENIKGKGNIIAVYPKEAPGRAWASTTDKTGRQWWLVEMEPAVNLSFSRFWDADHEPTHYFGWMSNRFLEVMPDSK